MINCKIHLELNWDNNCVIYGPDTYASGDNANNRETTFEITTTKLYVSILTLSTKDSVNLTKQLNDGFKRSVYWNEYKSKKKQKIQKIIILQDFHLMFLFKELIDSLFSILITLAVLIEFKETVIENIFFQE